ncbi:unnamed protein product [Linum tenue]|uniref:CRM domain-containing protein n=1 Tax=Linum tenue TaxID=586396 RepID=A0AAV0LUQ2_9ROSI|nr:unnamed protein product [Linum tenue]
MAAAMTSSTTTTTHILQRLLHPAPRQPPFPPCFFFRSIRSAAASSKPSPSDRRCRKTPITLFSAAAASPLPSHSALFLSTHSFCSPPQSAVSPALTFEEEEEYEEDDGEYEVEEGDAHEGFSDDIELDSDEEEEGDGEGLSAELEVNNGGGGGSKGIEQASLPKLSVKEKKELASYAHGLGDKLKSQLVGKSGVTDNVATSFIETLEANELLKIKIHRTCPGEMEDVVQHLVKLTGSIVVSQIGRTVIIYRPSISKMKAEEKRRQDRKMYVRRASNKPTFRPPFKVEHDSYEPKTNGRGRRGNSRFL